MKLLTHERYARTNSCNFANVWRATTEPRNTDATQERLTATTRAPADVTDATYGGGRWLSQQGGGVGRGRVRAERRGDSEPVSGLAGDDGVDALLLQRLYARLQVLVLRVELLHSILCVSQLQTIKNCKHHTLAQLKTKNTAFERN